MKIRIAIASGVSASVGYILSTDSISGVLIGAFFGTFFLAAGAASLNQIQEWKYDALMNRTKLRPIPNKYFTVKEAIPFMILFYLIGIGILMQVMISPITLLLGLSASALYNGVYTPLKRKTPFATIPGALIGVIPPILGWSLGSLNFINTQLIVLITFLFVWQIPHFYFLLFIFENDYRNAGFPVLTDRFSKVQISRICFLWIITLVFISLMLILTDSSYNLTMLSFYILAGIALLFRIRKLMFADNTAKYYKLAFMQLNLYVLLVLLSLSINKFLI